MGEKNMLQGRANGEGKEKKENLRDCQFSCKDQWNGNWGPRANREKQEKGNSKTEWIYY